jgi:hypothetical protein
MPQACEQLGHAVAQTVAAWQVEYQGAVGGQALVAVAQGGADVGYVFDDLIEHDDVELLAIGQRLGEVADAHRQPARSRLLRKDFIRLDPQHLEGARCRLQEPALGAAHVKQGVGARRGELAGEGDDRTAVLLPQRILGRFGQVIFGNDVFGCMGCAFIGTTGAGTVPA